jgi:hypothetical protein
MVRYSARRGDLSEFVLTGAVAIREWMDAYEAFLDEPTPLVLWDLTAATLGKTDAREVQVSARRLGCRSAGRPSPRRSALLCRRDVDFGVARQLAAFAEFERCPTLVGVFRNRDEACDWLAEEGAPG